MRCVSIRGWLFGGRHLLARMKRDWHGFERVVLFSPDTDICRRCGRYGYELAREAREILAEFDRIGEQAALLSRDLADDKGKR